MFITTNEMALLPFIEGRGGWGGGVGDNRKTILQNHVPCPAGVSNIPLGIHTGKKPF